MSLVDKPQWYALRTAIIIILNKIHLVQQYHNGNTYGVPFHVKSTGARWVRKKKIKKKNTI